MGKIFTLEDNLSLDAIIKARRSIRVFKSESLQPDDVDAIINAGLYAPYGGLANGTNDDFRRFFVFNRYSPQLTRLHDIIKSNAAAGALALQQKSAHDPELAERSKPFIRRMESLAKNGISGFEGAPCCIIIAERKGVPPVEKQALAHVMQNMWLKATALNLGLRLVSAIGGLADNQAFCEMLELKLGEFAMEGCIIGYPAGESEEPDLPQKLVTLL